MKVYSLDTLRQLKKENRHDEYGMIMIESQEDLEVHLKNAEEYTLNKKDELQPSDFDLDFA